MNDAKKHMSLPAKILLGVLIALLVLALILGAGIAVVWHNEIAAILSIQQIHPRDDAHQDGSVYTMKVKGGFYLEDFLNQGGVKNDDELIDFIGSHLTRGLIDIKVNKPNIGCSSFTARTPEGDWLFARNYDFSKTNTCIVFTEGQGDRHSTISTVDLHFLDIDAEHDLQGLRDRIVALAAVYTPLDGINDAGVSCGIYMTYQGGKKTVATDQDTQKPDVTSTTLLRLILDYAETVEEAVSIATTYDLHDSANTSFHYMVADASGRSAILEWVAGTDPTDNDGAQRQLVVTYNDEDDYIGTHEGATDYQIVTNFIIQPGYYADTPSSEQKGLDRYERLYQELDRDRGVVADEDAAMKILGTVGRRSWKNDEPNFCTVHSVVFNMTDRSMLWVPNEHYGDPSARFEYRLEK